MAGDLSAPELANVGEAYQWVVSQRAVYEAKPFHNALNASDCDADGAARLRDLLMVMQDLRDGGPRSLLNTAEGEGPSATSVRGYVDATGDNFLSLGDALQVIQTLRGEGEPGDIVMIRPEFGTGASEGGNVTIGDTFQVRVLVDDLREEDPNPNTPADDRGVVTGSTDVTYNSDLAGIEVRPILVNEQAVPFFATNYNTLPQIRVLDDAVRVHATFDVVKLAQGAEIGADEQLFVTLPFKVGAVGDFPTVAEDSTNNTIDVLANDTSASGSLQFATTFVPDTTAFPVNVFGVNNALPEEDIMFGTTNVNVTSPGTPTLQSITQPANGTATIQGGSVRYTPDGDFAGTDTFTYTISYPGGVTDTATVSVTVTNVADAPNAVDDPLNTAANALLNVPAPGVLGNDTDPDVDPDNNPSTPAQDSLTVTAVNGDTAAVGVATTLPSGATVTISSNGTLVYDPRSATQFQALGQGQTAVDTFTYTASDRLVGGQRRSDTATVSVTVSGVNDPPTAVNDMYETAVDTTLNVPAATGVRSNDMDPDTGDVLTISLVTGPANGTLTLNPNGSFSYTPDAGFEGPTDTFTYRATDPGGLSDTATVTINIISQPLRALPDAVQVNEGVTNVDLNAINPGITKNDEISPDNFDPRITRIQNTPINNTAGDDPPVMVQTANGGTVTFDPDQTDFRNVVISYTPPNPDFVGTDTFTYTIEDDDPASPRPSTATVTITVANVDDDPTNAVNDTVTPATPANALLTVPAAGVSVNGVANGNILTNDTDPDQQPITAVPGTFTSAQGATVTLSANGSFTYDPRTVQAFRALRAGETLSDTFTYTATDGGAAAGNDTATVTLTVAGVNDPPTAGPGTLTTNEDTLGTGDLNQFVADPDTGDTRTFTAATITTDTGATVTINANGTFSYDPRNAATLQALAVGESATDSFTYTVRDSGNVTSTGTVSVTITGVNDAPVAQNDSFVLDQDNGVFQTLDVLADNGNGPDSDPDTSDTLVITAVTQGSAGGTVEIAPGGRAIRYRHANNFGDTETFTYTISDGNGGSDTATVTVRIVAFTPSTISGYVYLDKDSNGVRSALDTGFANVAVTLTGTDINGATVNRTVVSQADDPQTPQDETGLYEFTDLPPTGQGGYKISVAPLPFMIDGGETAVNTDDTNTLGGPAPAGYSSMVSGANQIMITLPELGDVVSVNNNFAVRGMDPRFVSLADIIAQGEQFAGSGLAAVRANGQMAFSVAPTANGWEQFSNPTVTISPDGRSATIHAVRMADGHQMSMTVPLGAPVNGSNAQVDVIGQDNAGNRLVRFTGLPSNYGFTPAEGEASEFAQAADAIFAEGF
jgi:VCBS repeat-containing protein